MLVEAACRARGARVVRAQRAAGLVRVSLTPGHMSLREDSGAHYRTALVGDHQVSNLECAVAAARELRGRGFEISEPAIRCGLREVRWPARFEWLARRGVLLDVAHNPEAARCFARTYGATFRRPGVGVVGMLADKDAPGVARQLRACARLWVATAPEAERALSPEGMARALGRAPHVVVPGVARALKRALQERRRGEPVIVIGSLYTVGEAMARLGAHGQSRL